MEGYHEGSALVPVLSHALCLYGPGGFSYGFRGFCELCGLKMCSGFEELEVSGVSELSAL